MALLRILLLCAIFGSLAIYLGHIVVSGLRSGKIGHTDSIQICSRAKNPIAYWLLVAFFSALALASLYACISVIYQSVYG